MSSPGFALKASQVEIKDHPSDPKKFVVEKNDPFWVSKMKHEVAEWFCKRNHQHAVTPPCFTVRFDKDGTPFASDTFVSDGNGYARSDEIVVEPSETTIYHYRVQAHGKNDLDPGGGVKG